VTPERLHTNWTRIAAALERKGAGDGHQAGEGSPRVEIAPPAPRALVDSVETELGVTLPQSFRDVVTKVSGNATISWQLPEGKGPPKPLHEVFSGECSWDLQGLPELYARYREWRDDLESDPTDEYSAVWHGKIPFMAVPNGDYMTIDIASPGEQAVVYVSHDDGRGHGYRLGSTFADYLERCAALACVGSEDWQWLPFTEGPDSLLLPDSENAKQWRAWLGLGGSAGDV